MRIRARDYRVPAGHQNQDLRPTPEMQERESRAITTLATKMRLSQQSTYDKSKRKPVMGSGPRDRGSQGKEGRENAGRGNLRLDRDQLRHSRRQGRWPTRQAPELAASGYLPDPYGTREVLERLSRWAIQSLGTVFLKSLRLRIQIAAMMEPCDTAPPNV